MKTQTKTTAAKTAAAAAKTVAAADTGTTADAEAFAIAATPAAILAAVLAALDSVNTTYGDPDITPAQRRRLQGAGIRRYGFITKTMEISGAYPQYAPGTLDLARLERLVSNIEDLRNISIAARKLLTLVTDALLVRADEAYVIALEYYGTLREVARRNPAAADVFASLRPFFERRASRAADAEPTEAQVLRDTAALLHGTKDGEVVVKNRRPRTPPAERVVIDDTEH